MIKYYEINEEIARFAHNMRSMKDYVDGEATAEYQSAVNKAAELADKQKAAVSLSCHEKLDALLDQYAQRLARWINKYGRIVTATQAGLICESSCPTEEDEISYNELRALWKNYEEINNILNQIRSFSLNVYNLTDTLTASNV